MVIDLRCRLVETEDGFVLYIFSETAGRWGMLQQGDERPVCWMKTDRSSGAASAAEGDLNEALKQIQEHVK